MNSFTEAGAGCRRPDRVGEHECDARAALVGEDAARTVRA